MAKRRWDGSWVISRGQGGRPESKRRTSPGETGSAAKSSYTRRCPTHLVGSRSTPARSEENEKSLRWTKRRKPVSLVTMISATLRKLNLLTKQKHLLGYKYQPTNCLGRTNDRYVRFDETATNAVLIRYIKNTRQVIRVRIQ
ncbi:hypothetical protein AVEN_108829-1 [Araneus ventricosus]|uniref:Uncharacterized protein n=1 Tax=Araneus ventricosus TaxID=182803 RepID=A0A4Y2CDH1_ARAVE|nr:hypothetical protein AVEN_108829-1 [Araneus ventricosus]